MVDHVKTYGLMNFQGTPHTATQKTNLMNMFFDMVERNNIFVFGGTEDKEKVYIEDPKLGESVTFSSPFDVVSMELYGAKEYLTISNKDDSDRSGFNIGVLCYMYDDIKDFLFLYQYVTYDGGYANKDPRSMPGFDGKGYYTVLALDNYISSLMFGSSKAILGQYIDRINSEKVAAERVNEKIKIRSKEGTNKFHKINTVIHISKSKKYFTSEFGVGRKLDFSHRFFRRGHWRSYQPNHVGKDRHGVRNQTGRSWVQESIVGEENLPLINKIRVVGG